MNAYLKQEALHFRSNLQYFHLKLNDEEKPDSNFCRLGLWI